MYDTLLKYLGDLAQKRWYSFPNWILSLHTCHTCMYVHTYITIEQQWASKYNQSTTGSKKIWNRITFLQLHEMFSNRFFTNRILRNYLVKSLCETSKHTSLELLLLLCNTYWLIYWKSTSYKQWARPEM